MWENGLPQQVRESGGGGGGMEEVELDEGELEVLDIEGETNVVELPRLELVTAEHPRL